MDDRDIAPGDRIEQLFATFVSGPRFGTHSLGDPDSERGRFAAADVADECIAVERDDPIGIVRAGSVRRIHGRSVPTSKAGPRTRTARPMETPSVALSDAAVRDVVAGDPKAALVIALGAAYHQSGVPSDQLEELMHDVARALGLELQVTALPTSITAAIGPAYAQNVVLLRLEPGVIDLNRLARLNVVFERVLRSDVDVSHAVHEVRRIAALRHDVDAGPTIVAYAVLSLGAAIILGGGKHEITAAGLVGVATGALAVIGRVVPTVTRLFEVFAAFLATAIVTLYALHVHPVAAYVPLVAGVVQLLPGFQLTAALHELAYRNLVAGTARLGSVLMTLLSLGCGFALGIAFVGPSALHASRVSVLPTPWYLLALAVLAVAIGIAVLENARIVDYPLVLGSCAVAEVAYRLCALLPAHQIATFGAALTIGLVTTAGARFARIPQAVLLIPGLLILVPGSLSYQSILYILQSDAADAASIAVNSVIAAVEIVAGLLLAQLLGTPVRRRQAGS